MITENKFIQILRFMDTIEFSKSERVGAIPGSGTFHYRKILYPSPEKIIDIIHGSLGGKSLSLTKSKPNFTIIIRLEKDTKFYASNSYTEDIFTFDNLDYYHDELSFVLEHNKISPFLKSTIDEIYDYLKDLLL